MPDENTWVSLERNLQVDLINTKGLSNDIELDSLVLWGYGINYNNSWRGQKAFFDGVRLMGYADYDVGVKEILSGSTIKANVAYYPEAHIKNFGREDATDFIIVADILDGEQIIYTDTVTHSLSADTEDTVTFGECLLEPPVAETYTLAIHTFMNPDECEDDDQMSKTLTTSAVSESPSVAHLDLEITNTLTSSLRMFYSIPANQTGFISIFDQTGRRVQQRAVTGSGKMDFNAQLPAGVYIVRLESSGEGISKKAVVLR
jgi:hypothetical protein